VAFGTATIFEIGAYYIPLLDHLMDTLTTPAAVVAGTIMTASLVTDLSPFLKWTLALIAGGGVAGLVQTGSVFLRGASTAATGGFGNVLVSTGEIFGSILTTLLALILPCLRRSGYAQAGPSFLRRDHPDPANRISNCN